MSNTFRPALGRSFLHTVDCHMLLSTLPLRGLDAKLFYGTQYDGVRRQRPEMVSVLEVMADRRGDRVGKWAAFVVDRSVNLKGVVS